MWGVKGGMDSKTLSSRSSVRERCYELRRGRALLRCARSLYKRYALDARACCAGGWGGKLGCHEVGGAGRL